MLEHLIQTLSVKAEALGAALVDRKVSDFAEYNYMCGQYRGVMVAINLAKDLQKTQQEANDE